MVSISIWAFQDNSELVIKPRSLYVFIASKSEIGRQSNSCNDVTTWWSTSLFCQTFQSWCSEWYQYIAIFVPSPSNDRFRLNELPVDNQESTEKWTRLIKNENLIRARLLNKLARDNDGLGFLENFILKCFYGKVCYIGWVILSLILIEQLAWSVHLLPRVICFDFLAQLRWLCGIIHVISCPPSFTRVYTALS